MIARLHTYAGLLTFVNLMVFGLVGLSVVFGGTGPGRWEVHEQPFTVEAGTPDRVVAERVVALLGLTLATPVQNAAIQHDAAGRLLLDLWHANGRHRVTIISAPPSMKVEVQRSSGWRYLSILHANTAALRTGDWRMKLWSWYNEFALWTLFAMTASGSWLWLTRQPRNRAARVSLAAGLAVVAMLYWWGRR